MTGLGNLTDIKTNVTLEFKCYIGSKENCNWYQENKKQEYCDYLIPETLTCTNIEAAEHRLNLLLHKKVNTAFNL
jgi:hypothetical protein